jgi:hypothetical protein
MQTTGTRMCPPLPPDMAYEEPAAMHHRGLKSTYWTNIGRGTLMKVAKP